MAVCNQCGANLQRQEQAVGLCTDCQRKIANGWNANRPNNSFVTPQQSQRNPVKPSKAADILAYVIIFVFICVFVFVGVYRITRYIVWDEPLISTPRPTFTPTPTPAPTPVPDDLSTLVEYFVSSSLPADMSAQSVLCLKYDTDTSNIVLILEMDAMSGAKAYLRASARFIHSFLRQLATLDGLRDVTINISGPFVDVYGNKLIDTGVRVEYSMDTIRKINYDYFDSDLYFDPARFLRTADDLYIHPAYQ